MDVIRLGVMLTLAVVLTGCSDGRIDDAKKAVQLKLNDPDSAQFRNMNATYFEKVDLTEVCGEVNSKNRMGGMAGFRKFIYSAEVNQIEFEPDASDEKAEQFLRYWHSLCPSSG